MNQYPKLRLMLPYRFLFLSLFTLLANISSAKVSPPEWVAKVGSAKLSFKKKHYTVNDYGARADGQTLNTQAIQKTIDLCASKGGGTVKFAPGKYLTGSLFVREGVNLQIDKGVEILGSQNINDYPEIDTRAKHPRTLLVAESSDILIKGPDFQ